MLVTKNRYLTFWRGLVCCIQVLRAGRLGSSLFLDFQPLTLDFQLLIPD
jgi:hypothetical protein